MSVPTQATPQPTPSADPDKQPPSVGNVPLLLVLLSAVLVLVPGSRPFGVFTALVLLVPAIVTWRRARKLTDGSRGVTTAAVVIAFAAFVLGCSWLPAAPTTADAAAPAPAAPVPAPLVEQAALTPASAVPPAPAVVPAPVVFAPAPVATPAPRPLVQAPATRVTPAPQFAPRVVAPATRAPAAAAVPKSTGGGAAYFANCAAAKAAGAAPLSRGDAGYRAGLDRDNDGTACE